MKKRLISILTLLATLCAAVPSCTRVPELEPIVSSETDDDAPAGKVKVRFSVGITELEASLTTKADTRGETPNLQSMHVAVFGGSGYLKQYEKATLVTTPTDNDQIRTYEVELWLTNSSIKVHFIGNGPSNLRFDYETNCIPELYSSLENEHSDAYWQRITIPRGIRAKTATSSGTGPNGTPVAIGDYIDQYGNKITGSTGYVVADETVEAMSNIKLIRNFAQISVEAADASTSNFDLISYTLVNEPLQGTIAPYTDTWLDYLSYVDDGGTNAYEDLLAAYKGSEYVNTTYDASYPAASAFTSTPLGTGVIPEGSVGYIYERPAPRENPTYLIVYGQYKKEGDPNYNNYCYYKIDLMEKGVYLTLFRNFKYKITIKHVAKFGKTTPKSAAEGAGSGDVSADAEAASLTDISDGECQLYVTEMQPILVEEYKDFSYAALMYKFVYKVNGNEGDAGDAAVDNNYTAQDQQNTITVEGVSHDNTGKYGGAGKQLTMNFFRVTDSGHIIPFDAEEEGEGDIISSFKLDPLPQPAATNYYRTIFFTTKAPSGSTKTEKFRIKATYVTGQGTESEKTHTLYRDVLFTLLKTQQLSVKCIPEEIEEGASKDMTVRITIPSGLPKAMFPLQFPIEIANNSLGPDYDHTDQTLPVTYGQTYQYTEDEGNKVRGDNNGYYFIRSLDYDEYSGLASSDGLVSFDSYFETTKAISESDIYVGCLPPTGKTVSYFEPNKTSFGNYIKRQFTWDTNYNDEHFWEANTDKTLTFHLDNDDIPQDVYVRLSSNLTPAQGSSNLANTATENLYKISNVVNGNEVTIKVHVTDAAGLPANVELSARHYDTNTQCTGTTGRWKEVTVVNTTTNTQTRTQNRSFARADFASNWTVTKTDITLALSNCVRTNNYISLGSDNATDYTAGTITVTGLPTMASTTTEGNVTTEVTNPWISKMVFTYTENNYSGGDNPSVSGGSVSNSSYSKNNTTGTWTGSAVDGLTFTMPYATSERRGGIFGIGARTYYYGKRITKIDVTYSWNVITTTSTTTTEPQWVTSDD